MSSTRPLKVFLCHASVDKPAVRKLYRYLKERKMDAWLDAEKLMPGQNWQVEIPKALLSSDVIIICLSKNSVDKEGYVQKEIKFALDKALEMPEGRIFLIPARLEECDLPHSLSNYHYVNLFEEDGYRRLLKSLRLRAEQVGATKVAVGQDTISPHHEEPKDSSVDIGGDVSGANIMSFRLCQNLSLYRFLARQLRRMKKQVGLQVRPTKARLFQSPNLKNEATQGSPHGVLD
jgi:hypothetical protein